MLGLVLVHGGGDLWHCWRRTVAFSAKTWLPDSP